MYSTVYWKPRIDVMPSIELQNARIVQKASNAYEYDKRSRLIDDLAIVLVQKSVQNPISLHAATFTHRLSNLAMHH